MTAAYVTRLGPAAEIRVGSLPVPQPGAVEVLVRAEAMAVNHVDTYVRSGAYRTSTPFPFVVGRDLVGTVVGLGSADVGFGPGDRVWCNSLGYGGRQGSFGQYAVVPTDRLYPLPDGADPRDAVSVLHTAATAQLGLFREAGLRSGEVVVIGGAGGGVGSAAVQLAAASNARVIATSSAQDASWCRRCGTDVVLDFTDPQQCRRIIKREARGVDMYWDTSGHQDLAETLSLLNSGGRVVVSAGLSSWTTLAIGELYTRDASVHGFAISNASVADLAGAASLINALLGRRELRTRIALTLPLAEAARAHRLQESGAHRPGRIVVRPEMT
ncbi:MAG: NADPH:quinone reductase [Jatrophihabitantaceae bacterium]